MAGGGHVLQTVVEIAGSISPTLEKTVKSTTKQLNKIDLKSAAVAASVTAGFIGIGKAVIDAGKKIVGFASDYDKAMRSVSAQTGATGEELEALGDVVQQVYADNFGESMGEAADAVAEVRRLLGLEGDDLASAAKNAIALSDAFEFDIAESTRAASALMKNFGVTAEEAYNIIAYGAQNGANQNGDMLDVLNEYAAQYSALGLSADQFVQGLVKAGDEGVFSMDKVGDAVKEFNIRSKDLSTTSAEAYALLGMDADEMFARFAAGGETANEAFFEVLDALNNLDDPLAKNTAAVNLFGTQYEDLGEGILDILASMEGSTLDNVDAMEQLNEVQYGDLQSQLEGIGRQLEVAFLPLGSTLLDAISGLMPAVTEAVGALEPMISGLTESLTPLITDVFGQLGPMLTELMQPIMRIADVLFEKILPPLVEIGMSVLPAVVAIVDVLAVALEPIFDILGDVLPIIADIVSMLGKMITSAIKPLSKILKPLGDQFSDAFSFLEPIGDIVSWATSVLSGWVDFISNIFTGNWSAAWNSIAGVFENIWNGVIGFFKGIANGIIGMVEGAINGIINAINAITGGLSSVWTWTGIPEIPEIPLVEWPRLASGGFTNGVSIAGEEGPEAVISFDPHYHDANVALWAQAGRLLGVLDAVDISDSAKADIETALESFSVTASAPETPLTKAGELAAMDEFSLGSLTETTIIYYDFSGFTWAPQVSAPNGQKANAAEIMNALRDNASEFFDWLEEWVALRDGGRYDTVTVY